MDTRLPTFLLGAWQGEHKTNTLEERWWQVHPDLMVGLSRTLKDGQEIFREHLQILRAEARLVYTAWPAGQEMTPFTSPTAGANAVLFENPAHDFPRKIQYRRQDQALTATISGVQDGKPLSREFRWKRMPDPAAGLEPIKLTIRVPATPLQVFEAWTTTAGVNAFFSPSALVEPRAGGRYEMYFVKEAPPGKQGSEGCVIVELDPPRKVAFTWNFPPNIPELRDAHTLVTVEIKPEGKETSVSVVHAGFQAGEKWQEGRAYFSKAWRIVLDRLMKHFNNADTFAE